MDINLTSITKSLSTFLHRYHVIVFVIIVLGALGLGIFIIYQETLASDLAQGYTAQANNTTFDAETSNKLSKLHPADQPSESRDINTSGDVNPFVE